MTRPRLIATDLDGTLLRTDKSVSVRTREVIEAVVASGIEVVPVTARRVKNVREIAAAMGVKGPVISGNGAVGFDLATDEPLFTQPMSADTVARAMDVIRGALPEVHFALIGPTGEGFCAEPGYADLCDFGDHQMTASDMEISSTVGGDGTKLVMRHAGHGPAELHALVEALDLPPCQLTHSGAPFLEITGPGVTKASGLERLCARLGITSEHVWAFGDAANDVPMIRWAAVGHAMANAVDEVKAAADRIIGSNDDDAVAAVLTELL